MLLKNVIDRITAHYGLLYCLLVVSLLIKMASPEQFNNLNQPTVYNLYSSSESVTTAFKYIQAFVYAQLLPTCLAGLRSALSSIDDTVSGEVERTYCDSYFDQVLDRYSSLALIQHRFPRSKRQNYPE